MRRNIILAAMLVGVVALFYFAYSAQNQPHRASSSTPNPPPAPPAVPFNFTIGDRPVVSKGDFTFATQIVTGRGKGTQIIYSISESVS